MISKLTWNDMEVNPCGTDTTGTIPEFVLKE
jgi:hypothetical protein